MENADRYLFRGRRKGCAWVYGALIVRDGIPFIVQLDDHMGTVLFAVDPESVGQCSGEKDKNDTAVFEKDIVVETSSFTGKVVRKMVIKYNRSCFEMNDPKQESSCPVGWITTNEIEVIGNVYDNPELIEASEKDMPCSSPS